MAAPTSSSAVDEPSDLGAWSYEPLRHQARAQREAGGRAPARLVRGRDRRDPGAARRSECTSCSAPARSRPIGRPMSTPTCASHSSGCARTSSSGPRHIRGRASTARAATSSRSAASAGSSDDHLTRVASIRRDQIGKLATVDVDDADGSRRGAGRPSPFVDSRRRWSRSSAIRPPFSSTATASGELTLPPARARGAARARAPSRRRPPGDVFFDMEGDPFYDPACGLEFLFGVLWREADGTHDVPAVLGARPRRGAARVRGVRRLRR